MRSSTETAGFFVSDLHLFARRSTGDFHLQSLHACAERAHTLILGGDIFDFKWSTLGSFDRTLDASIEWLQALLESNRQCKVEFILGNHDANQRFAERLEQLAQATDQFSWHRYFLRREQCLFLHGDIADGVVDHHHLDRNRMRFEHHRTPRRRWHLVYDVACRTRVHNLISAVAIRRELVTKRIVAYAKQIGEGPEAGVRDVYFGHTHCEMDGIEHGGLRLHNGGAAIRNTKFRIIETSLSKSIAQSREE